jgi:branched-chain amino acid transport system substrate-binding protein
VLIAAVTVVLALVAAACGSSSKSNSSSGGGTGTTVAAPKGTPIKIGWIGPLTTATGSTPNVEHDATDAWVSWVNTHGGIAGHPIEVNYADDKNDPAVALAAVKDLVENKGVIAIVGETAAATQQTWKDYVLSKRIPVIGGPLIDSTWFTNAMFYPVGGSVVTNIWGQMKSAAALGNTKVAVVLCTENPACAQAQPLFTKNATEVGMTMVYNALASTTQASYTAECLAAKNAGATAVANFTNVVVMVRDCERQNYNPYWISSGQGPGLSLIKQQPALGKAVGSSEVWNCLDLTIPETTNLNAAMKVKHANWLEGGKDHDLSGGGCIAWSSYKAFAKALENAGVTATSTVTNEDVIKGLAAFKGETLGGIAPPLSYSDGTKPTPQVTCTTLYKWENLKVVTIKAPNGSYWTCNP